MDSKATGLTTEEMRKDGVAFTSTKWKVYKKVRSDGHSSTFQIEL